MTENRETALSGTGKRVEPTTADYYEVIRILNSLVPTAHGAGRIGLANALLDVSKDAMERAEPAGYRRSLGEE